MIERFGTSEEGDIERITLDAHGLTVKLLTYGGAVQDLRLEGVSHALNLGFETLEPYLAHTEYFGAIVGPVANRISGASCDLEGRALSFDPNWKARHTLHSGARGVGRMLWRVIDHSDDQVIFACLIKDGDMGFPGPIEIRAHYEILPGPLLQLTISSKAEQVTLTNLAPHIYFNLDGSNDVRGHRLQIDADHYLPIDEDLIPTGEVAPIEGTGFDFRQSANIADAGLDHNFCLTKTRGPLQRAMALTGQSGTRLEIATSEPGLQVYNGSGVGSQSQPGLNGFRQSAFAGLALEPQAWPDAMNQGWQDQVILKPGETRQQISQFAFFKV